MDCSPLTAQNGNCNVYIFFMTERFQRMYSVVMAWEGGYVNHPNDPGGETYRGISRRAHPHWEGWQYIDSKKAVPESLVASFYYINFWNKLRCEDMPYPIGEYLFDFGVNAGIDRAARLVQSLVGVKVDGIVGEVTLSAIKRYDTKELMNRLLVERLDYYIGITSARKQLSVFFLGWVRRTLSTYKMLIGNNH